MRWFKAMVVGGYSDALAVPVSLYPCVPVLRPALKIIPRPIARRCEGCHCRQDVLLVSFGIQPKAHK